MKIKNILIFTHYGGLYGANLSILNLALILKQSYHMVPMLVMPENGGLNRILRKSKIHYMHLPYKRWMVSKEEKNLRGCLSISYNNIKAVYDITKRLKEKNFIADLVVSGSSMVNLGILYATKTGKKHIWFIRECEDQYNFTNLYPKYITKMFFAKSSKTIFISKFALKEFRKKYGNLGNEAILYNGVERIREKKKQSSRMNKTFKFCITGVIHPNKGQVFVAEAFRKIYEQGYCNFELFIIGDGDKKELTRINEICRDNSFGNHVRMLGYCYNVNEILEDMDAGIMASYKEMFGRVTAEYMMAGLPVIASRSGANEEIVINGRTGLTYEYGNMEQLTECLLYCINHQNEVKEMGENGKKRAEKFFTKERNAKEFVKIISEI